MIDALAKALWDEQRMGDQVEYRNLFSFRQEELRDEVRAVLNAARSPTPEIIAAVWSKIDDAKLAKGIVRLGPGPGVCDVIAAYMDAISNEQVPA